MLGFISCDDQFKTKHNTVDNIKLLRFRVALLFFKLLLRQIKCQVYLFLFRKKLFNLITI